MENGIYYQSFQEFVREIVDEQPKVIANSTHNCCQNNYQFLVIQFLDEYGLEHVFMDRDLEKAPGYIEALGQIANHFEIPVIIGMIKQIKEYRFHIFFVAAKTHFELEKETLDVWNDFAKLLPEGNLLKKEAENKYGKVEVIFNDKEAYALVSSKDFTSDKLIWMAQSPPVKQKEIDNDIWDQVLFLCSLN